MLISFYHLGLTFSTGVESPPAPPPPSGITLDAISEASGAGVSSLSWAHTVGAGANRILMVTAAAFGGLPASGNSRVTGVTFGGTALTRAVEQDNWDGSIATSLWYWVNPTPGAGTIVVTYTGSCEQASAGAISLSGVHQSSPINVTASRYGWWDTDTISGTTTIDKCWSIDVYVARLNLSLVFSSWGAGQTENWQDDANNGVQWYSSGSSREPDVATGTVSHTVTLSRAAHGAHVLAAIAPA